MVKNPAQLVFLLIPLLYVAAMGSVVLSRSGSRRSVIEASGALGSVAGSNAVAKESIGNGSQVQIQEFHRVEIKEGKPVWEVRARDAKYFPQEMVTHVNEASLVVFREESTPVTIDSRAARLNLSGQSLQHASLEGAVNIKVGDSFALSTEVADYSVVDRRVFAPGEVKISGKGFEVEGEGLTYDVDSEALTIAHNVRCTFHPNAEVPRGILP